MCIYIYSISRTKQLQRNETELGSYTRDFANGPALTLTVN